MIKTLNMRRIICFLAIFVFCGVMTFAQKREGGVKWKFDGITLYIFRGQDGVIPNYDRKNHLAPWIKQKLPIKKVEMDGIEHIGSCAFANCETLESVVFSNLINKMDIGAEAFYNCKRLSAISIPGVVKNIGELAFAYCQSLTAVVIPKRTIVGDFAYLSCSNLQYIEIGDGSDLHKAVFATAVSIDGHTKYKLYSKRMGHLPRTINEENCAAVGLDPTAVAAYIKRENKKNEGERDALVSDVDISDGNYSSGISRNDTYALIIGNQFYRYASYVDFALHDAEMFMIYCKIILGIPSGNIKFLPDATKYEILEIALEDWLKRGIDNKSDKKLIVYYAGHGIPDRENRNRSYLLPVDVDATKPQHGIALDELYSTIGGYGYKLVTFFIDACFSGGARDKSGIVSGQRANEVEAQDVKPFKGNVVVFTAAHGTETAQPLRDTGHGLFTYYLLKALGETNGEISYKDLADYLKKNVSDRAASLDMRQKQTPTVASSLTDQQRDNSKL